MPLKLITRMHKLYQAVLLTACEMFLLIETENLHFRPLYSDCRPPSGETPSNINIIYTSLKSRGTVESIWQWVTILLQTVRVCLKLFSRSCLSNVQNLAKGRENSNSHPRSSTLGRYKSKLHMQLSISHLW